MADLNRIERLIRSQILAVPFVLTNLATRFEVHGRENLFRALERRRHTGQGLVTISNHQSLFDDPLLLASLLGIKDFNVESKCWWSTPCASNFSPKGDDPKARFVRYFSDVSNMVFFSRPAKKGAVVEVPSSYLEELIKRRNINLLERVMERASDMGMGGESFLRRFLTEGSPIQMAPLNQMGMIEACARVSLGDWLHFFPEGGRSRTLDLRPPKRGPGKVIYHSPQAEVIPFCFCGMQDVMPVKKRLPRPFKRVVVLVGEPVDAGRLAMIRQQEATPAAYAELVRTCWEPIENLWPAARALYEGEDVDLSAINTPATIPVDEISLPVAPRTTAALASVPPQRARIPSPRRAEA